MMRPALVCLLLAGAAANPDCAPHAFVRSFHPWTAGYGSHCGSDLTGGWQLRGADSGQTWYLWQEQRDTSFNPDCGYVLLLVDTALARSLASSAVPEAIFSADRRARTEIGMSPAAMATWQNDSTKVYDILQDVSRRSLLVAGIDSVGGGLFLNVTPFPRKYESTPFGLTLMVPTNWVFRAETSGDTLRLYPLSRHWVDTLLDAEPGLLAHEHEFDVTLITAPTESLSRFLLHHARDTLAFPPALGVTFTRIRP